MPKPTCRMCPWFHLFTDDEMVRIRSFGWEVDGHCRVNPPKMIGDDGWGCFPAIPSTFWCGERFERKAVGDD